MIKCRIIYAEVKHLATKRSTQVSNSRIVSVKDEYRAYGQCLYCLTPSCRHTIDFAVTIKLVEKKIRKHSDTRRYRLNRLRYDRLINLHYRDASHVVTPEIVGKDMHDNRAGHT